MSVELKCRRCGKTFYSPPKLAPTRRHCSMKCYHDGLVGEKHPNWRGGVMKHGDGRKMVYAPGDPQQHGSKLYAYNYRLVAAKILGRPLARNEVVHHINGDRSDDRPENLQIMTQGEHMTLHAALRRAKKNGGQECAA